jgi:hypothetical protein
VKAVRQGPLIAELGGTAHNESLQIRFSSRLRSRVMPIKVQCACGKAFAAKDELAGKTVKCPNCQQPLKIPAAAAAAVKSPAKPATAAASKPGQTKPAAPAKPAAAAKPAPAGPRPAAPAAPSGESLFDEIGLQAAEAGTQPCPGCTQPMPIGAVICINCGYNTRIGRRMETVKIGGLEEGGHGAVAQDMLDKAATVMEEDAAEEKKKTGEGLPWWVYLIALGALIGLATWLLTRGGGEKSDEKKKGFVPKHEDRPIVRVIENRGVQSSYTS